MHDKADLGFPLEGLKVLDLSRVLAGPLATRMLSDLGADVLKIEPPEGDISRHLGRTEPGASGFYLQQNVGKRNICMDLKAEGARELVLDLARRADILVENFRPGVMQRLGLGWADLHAANPRLVMLSISGFGQEGPERGRAAYAPVLHAEAGLIARQASVSGSIPQDLQVSFADTVTALHGLVGLLVALRSAEHTGIGQQVDISMMSAVHASDDFAHWALDDSWPRPTENLVWDAPEGRSILISSSLNRLWDLFSTIGGLNEVVSELGKPEELESARVSTLQAHILSFDKFGSLIEALDRMNLAWGLVRAFGADGFEQPSALALGVVVEVEDDDGQKRRTVQSPYRFSGARSGIIPGIRLPRRGENNIQALQDWIGLSISEIESLKQRGILLQ